MCEVERHIITKAVLVVTDGDNQDAVGSAQLCAEEMVGMEAVHALLESFRDENNEAAMHVDTSKTLNRQSALANIRHLCPAILMNAY